MESVMTDKYSNAEFHINEVSCKSAGDCKIPWEGVTVYEYQNNHLQKECKKGDRVFIGQYNGGGSIHYLPESRLI